MGVNLGADPIALGQEVYDFSTTQKHPLGTRAVVGGREYRYVKAGGSNLVAGNVVQAPAQVTTHDQLTPSAAALGATAITVTLDSTNAATANQYAEGLAVVDTTPGLGYAYPIIGHPAASASTAVTIQIGQPVQVALTTSSRVTLTPNRFNGVIQAPTTLTGAPVGVAISPITAGSYGWIQTKGECGVLIAGTPAVGAAVGVPGSAAGAVVVDGAATSGLIPVGTMMVTGVDGKVLPVNINFP